MSNVAVHVFLFPVGEITSSDDIPDADVALEQLEESLRFHTQAVRVLQKLRIRGWSLRIENLVVICTHSEFKCRAEVAHHLRELWIQVVPNVVEIVNTTSPRRAGRANERVRDVIDGDRDPDWLASTDSVPAP